MRENAAAKATRLLAEGRVAVLRAGSDGVLALVRGDSSAFYWVEWDPYRPRWTCTCPALGRCSHAIAVQRITAVDGLQLPIPVSA